MEGKKGMKKLLIALLVALTVFTLCTATVFAAEAQNEAKIGEQEYATVAEAIANANAGETVTLLNDVTTNEKIQITKAITLDLNGKTITANSQKAIEVYADATIKNGTIKAIQRCVDTRTAVELSLDSLTLIADKYHNEHRNPQPLTIGGSTHGTVVVMNNVKAYSGTTGYCIITFVETELTATNCDFYGYNTIYVKPGSEGSEFNFVSSTIRSDVSNNDVAGNSFAAIAVCTNNVAVNIDATSKVNAIGNNSYAFGVGNEFDTPIVTGVKVESSAIIEGNILDTDSLKDNAVKVPAEYSEKLADEGFIFEANGDGTISSVKVATTLENVFTFKGYSYDLDTNRVVAGYTVNHESFATYAEENGNASVDFGAVFAAYAIGENAIENSLAGVSETKNYYVFIGDVTEEYYDLDLIVCMYVNVDGEKKYITESNKKTVFVDADKVIAITVNQIIGGNK